MAGRNRVALAVCAQTKVIFPFNYRPVFNVKVKKYRKTSRATSNVGYQTNVVFESASKVFESSALDFLAHNLFVYLFFFCAQFIYLFILCCNKVLYTGA